MTEIYRVYLKSAVEPGNPVTSDKTITGSRAAALAAFTELVNRTEFDGQRRAAVLSRGNRQVAYHRFDQAPGLPDYWRDRLDEIAWPQ